LIEIDPDVVYFHQRHTLRADHQLSCSMTWHCFADSRRPRIQPGWLSPEERSALCAFLDQEPRIERVSRYQYRLDHRKVDFGSAVLSASAQAYPIGDDEPPGPGWGDSIASHISVRRRVE
jgi:hypothetical protein